MNCRKLVVIRVYIMISCNSLQSIDPSTENSAMIELEKHTHIIEQLLEIATETDLNFDEREYLYNYVRLV